MKSAWTTRRGLALLECLFALCVMALLFEAAILTVGSYRQVVTRVEDDHGMEWQNFALLFEAELQHFQLVQVDPHRLILSDVHDTTKRYSLIVNKHRLYKQPGYQPYLYEVADWQLSRQDASLHVEVTFTNGQHFETSFWLPTREAPTGGP